MIRRVFRWLLSVIEKALNATPTPLEIKIGLAGVLTISVTSMVFAFVLVRFNVPEARQITGTQVKVVAPASPGLVHAIDICKFGEISRIPVNDGDGWKYTAVFGLDVLQWPDSPPGKQSIALVNGEPVVLSEEVKKCLSGKF